MEQVIALILATAVLVAIPGPNVAVIVAVSLRHGFKRGALVVTGTTLGITLQLSFVVLGFAAVLSLTAGLMLWIKWLGAAYLIWLGIRAWRSPVDGPEVPAPRREPSAPAFWQGLGIAIINPKTLMFNAAFLPQFVPDGSGPVQLAIFGLIYLTVLFAGDLLWAAFADRARRLFGKFSHLRNKVEGGFLVGAGAGLALARIRE